MFRKLSITAAVALAMSGAAHAQISDGVIKIGVLNDQSSLYADISGQGGAVAARMAVEDFGAAKKGMKVEVISADHQNKPEVGSSIARQWYDVDKVDVIVDVPTSSVALAVNQITREKGKAFLVSGAATSLMLQRAGASASLLATRARRLLLPLLLGMALIVPPQSYFEVVQQYGYAGSFVEFMRLYYSGHGGFCGARGSCLILPTWNHLWFVAYLFAYTLALWLLVRVWPRALDALAALLSRGLRGVLLLGLPIAVLALLRVTLASRFPATHALVDDWYLHACYFGVFLLGAVWARDAAMWQRCAEQRCPALWNADTTTSSTTCSGSAEASTSIALTPPVSAISVAIGPGRAASAALMRRAVSSEPVKATPAMRASATSGAPTLSPSPTAQDSTSAGMPD